ncbi:hypothetical protein BDV93DRAFT_447031 [Ceratobasidium sp. AG-I]|nr:hypothetical protein BDV93DRAFT_461529 [Ceratobasidium sp. AG-I]KAF8600662.1 hypothetical protein BDV93DRAFT_447031 [Ceratobasidium sp. AG-I]
MLAIWTAVNHRPFHTLSDPLFIEIVRLLRADASVPTPHTVSNDLARIYNQVAVSIQEKFKEMDIAFHLAIDGWSSPLTASFLGVIVFWFEEGKIWRCVLEFIQ